MHSRVGSLKCPQGQGCVAMLRVAPQSPKASSASLFQRNQDVRGSYPEEAAVSRTAAKESVGSDRATEETIHNLETNRTVPAIRFIPRIINFLGYAPYDPRWTFGQWLKAIRSALGLSQEQLVRRVGLDEGNVSKWEREVSKPTRRKWAVVKSFFRSAT